MGRVLLSVVLLVFATSAQAQNPFEERPAEVTVTMSTSRGMYDGSYTLREVARVCGEVPGDLNFAGGSRSG